MTDDRPRYPALAAPIVTHQDVAEDTESGAAEEGRRPTKQVFVAYSYRAYPKADYRKVFTELEKAYDVKFIFADEKITNMHIMAKIVSYIQTADFSLFDITGWNPNVTLELGWAMASVPNGWYICFDPTKTDIKEVPSDLRGIDRIEYDSYTSLQAQVSVLLEQRYSKRKAGEINAYLDQQRDAVLALLHKQPGLKMTGLAQILGVDIGVAQLIMGPLVGKAVETIGQTKGMRYYLKGEAPRKG